jgi:PAT family beta-lactamase induction signal transducer AmpG
MTIFGSVIILALLSATSLPFVSKYLDVPFLQNLGFPDYAFGYLWSAMGAVGIFAPFISLKFLKKGQERKFILHAIILTILVLILVIFAKSVLFAFMILLFQSCFSGMSRPVERNYFHKFIKNKLRATIGSLEGMLIMLAGLLAMPLTGLSIDYFGAKYTILLSALLMIPSAIIFLKIKEKK